MKESQRIKSQKMKRVTQMLSDNVIYNLLRLKFSLSVTKVARLAPLRFVFTTYFTFHHLFLSPITLLFFFYVLPLIIFFTEHLVHRFKWRSDVFMFILHSRWIILGWFFSFPEITSPSAISGDWSWERKEIGKDRR